MPARPPVMAAGSLASAANAEQAPQRSGGVDAGAIQVRRSGVGALPVSGNGSMAAGVASSVAGEVARSAVESALTERLDRSVAAPGSTGVARQFEARETAQRALADEGAASTGAVDVGDQRDELLRFTMSDEFEERLLEFLEDRLLGEIERRGGRYGGWFA